MTLMLASYPNDRTSTSGGRLRPGAKGGPDRAGPAHLHPALLYLSHRRCHHTCYYEQPPPQPPPPRPPTRLHHGDPAQQPVLLLQ
ncbi:unnamed protein product [Gadus morhua 'NCC']